MKYKSTKIQLLVVLLLSSNFLYQSSVLAKGKNEKSLELFQEGKTQYKQGDYPKAESLFIKSLRFMQDHQTMYYRALAVSKNTVKSCEDKVSCWQNYLDFCNTDKNSNCVSSWLNKAEKHHKKVSNSCSQGSLAKASKESPKVADRNVLAMTTSFQCQLRQKSGIYKPQRICNGEYFTEDDQVRFEITPKQDGYLYVLVHNDSGQMQMVFPETRKDKYFLKAGQSYMLPSDPYFKGWWNVDNQKNVKERITIILTKDKDTHLEELRGVDLKPEQAKNYLRVDAVKRRSLSSWKDQGRQSEIKGDGICIESIGDSNKVVTQYFFNHE